MFEKETEQYCTHQKLLEDVIDNIYKAFEDGAEFGYNKANEWHYMKDGDLPYLSEEEQKDRVFIWKVQVLNERGIKQPACYHCGSYGDLWYEVNAYHVIAWEEIVLPKEIEK